jgi:hypothetical protein
MRSWRVRSNSVRLSFWTLDGSRGTMQPSVACGSRRRLPARGRQ